ncbi:MAG: hypothetical protein RBU30_05700 [Polyangia bacterium]|jgi:hypothetical protein|nr:hypothetical protein [Polyangia bacterium]
MAKYDNPDRARMLARAIASDLMLYNEERLTKAIQNDSVFEDLREEIEEGRTLFQSRVTDEVFGLNLYERAIVDVMIKSKGHVKSKIW